MTKINYRVSTQNYRLCKEADKFQNHRCFVHSFTLSLCVVYIQSTRYGYIVIMMIPGQLVKRRMFNLYISRVLSQWAMMGNDEADSTNLQLRKINRQILFYALNDQSYFVNQSLWLTKVIFTRLACSVILQKPYEHVRTRASYTVYSTAIIPVQMLSS